MQTGHNVHDNALTWRTAYNIPIQQAQGTVAGSYQYATLGAAGALALCLNAAVLIELAEVVCLFVCFCLVFPRPARRLSLLGTLGCTLMTGER